MSATFPSQTIAQRVLARIIDNARPMPPSGLLAAAQRSPLQAWIEAGTPAESCDQGPGMPPIEPPPPGPATVVCSSGDYYQPRSGREDDGEPDMNPGLACRNCHLREKPRLAFAFMGTVFPTLHEADLCISQVPVNTEVHIVDADGVVALKLPVRRNGNFMSASAMSSVKRPFTAKVVNQNGVRQMTTPQMNGDCNGCHSEQGANGAPGRILIPQR